MSENQTQFDADTQHQVETFAPMIPDLQKAELGKPTINSSIE